MLTIYVAKDYTETPGGRTRDDGDYSGEDFRERFLEPNYLKAVENKVGLLVDLDGGYGYAPSFLEEAFGGLARKYSADVETILQVLTIKSDDEPGLIRKIAGYIQRVNNSKKVNVRA